MCVSLEGCGVGENFLKIGLFFLLFQRKSLNSCRQIEQFEDRFFPACNTFERSIECCVPTPLEGDHYDVRT